MHDAKETWSHDPQYDTLFEETFGFDHVLYADDTNLLSPTARSVRAMLHAVEEEAGRYGFQLNKVMDKTTLLRLGAARQIPPPLIRAKNGTQIREKEMDTTLGFPLGQNATNRRMVNTRAAAMRKAMNDFKLIWTSRLSIKQKVEKYKSLVLSKGIWGLHLLALGKTEIKKMEYHHARCIRRILGIKASYVSRISNEEVLKRAGVPSFKSFLRQKQYMLLGHIMRLPEQHPDWRVCFRPGTQCEPCMPHQFRRRTGRPRARWAEILFEEIFKLYPQCSRQEIVQMAKNRNRWRAATSRLSSE